MNLVKWDEIKHQIETCKDIDILTKLANKIEAIRIWAKQEKLSTETQNQIAEYKLRCSRKIGQWSLELEKEPGKRTDLTSDQLGQRLTKGEILDKAGIARGEVIRKEAIASLPDEEFEKHIADVKASHEELTTTGILRVARVLQRESRDKGLWCVDIPEGEYTVIYADPPWRYDFSETVTREIENQYPTMDIEEIKNMTIPSHKDSVLFLWATAPKLKEGLNAMESWGFNYKTHAIWDKGKIGMGYWFRGQHELLLVGTKGNYSPPLPENRISSVIYQEREGHSLKPELYEIIEKMCPNGKYLELFARGGRARKSWTFWGNQSK